MIPDIQLQLKSVAKSLKDNVLPAVDPNNELAQQQIQLSIATLEIAVNNLPLIHSVMRKDIEQHLAMAQQILTTAIEQHSKKTLTQLSQQAAQVLADPQQGLTQLQHEARELRAGIGETIANNPDLTELEAIVFRFSETTVDLGRALNKPMGFEASPNDIRDVASLLTPL